MQIEDDDINKFQTEVFDFYREYKRELPWRDTTDPYHILISEFMLQQTQVSRVISYYTKWIKRWPTIHDLADASFKDVVTEWIGLGYNRRAKYLHETSKKIISLYDGDVLLAMNDYKDLPGIGEYTSKAVRIFSGNKDIVTVDTNIRRILIHNFHLDESVTDSELYEIALQCLPMGKSRQWHNALMDYGALELTSNKTGIKAKTKQPKFEGSDRQIRGLILKILLSNNHTFQDLLDSVHTDEARLKTILDKMVGDNIISNNDDVYTISNK